MTRKPLGVLALAAAAAFVAACGDDSTPSSPVDTGGPSFAVTPAFPCTFNGNPSLSKAIGDYFTVSSEKSTANGYASQMQTAYNTAPAPNFVKARGPGFDLLKFVGDVARAGHGSSRDNGAAVIRQAIQCMYNVSAATGSGQLFEGWPTNAQFDFASALDFASGGAYSVRGDATKDALTAPVVARIAGFVPEVDGNASVMAPTDTSDWSKTLKQRVLIYGNVVPLTGAPTGYDWKLIPRDATFDPNGVVALCNGLGLDFLSSGMIHQEGVGMLAFLDATALCGTNPVVAVQSPSLFGRLTQFAARALTPAPAFAATTLVGKTGGGGIGGVKSDVFNIDQVTNVTLEWFQAPPAVMRLGQSYTVIAGASSFIDNAKTFVNGTCLVITGANNNGTPTQLNGSKECGSPNDVQVSAKTTFRTPPKQNPGFATFTITPTKTGGLSLTLSAVSLVNLGTVNGNNTLVAKVNVKP
jgi:hypothetical protein